MEENIERPNVTEINKEKVQSYFERTRDYAKAHAPQLITAAASVVSAIAAVKLYQIYRDTQAVEVAAKTQQQNAINNALQNGLDFEHFPGVGVVTYAFGPAESYTNLFDSIFGKEEDGFVKMDKVLESVKNDPNGAA